MDMSMSIFDDFDEFDFESDDLEFNYNSLDGEDEFDFESELDEFVWAAPLGGVLGGAGAGAAYDWTQKKLNSYGKNSTAGSVGKWMKNTGWARDLATGTGAALGTALGALIPEDADNLEPEFSSEDIETMEALAEEALEAGNDFDAMEASDQMVVRSFGIGRASATLRQKIMPVLVKKVRAIIARARRDPKYRILATLAPLALRRTAVTLLRIATRRQAITASMALTIFSRTLSTLVRQRTLRQAALRNSSRRRRRYYSRTGRPRPTVGQARRPSVSSGTSRQISNRYYR